MKVNEPGISHRHRVALPAALLLLTLAFAPPTEAYVYWVSGNDATGYTVGRANLDGSGVQRNFIALPFGSGLAVDDTHVYWTGDSIGRANLDGTGVNQDFITGSSTTGGVAVDGSHVYWMTSAGLYPGGGTIARANLDGTGVDEGFITGVSFPSRAIAVGDSHLYWGNTSPDVIHAPHGGPNRIGRASLDGSGVEEGFIPFAAGLGVGIAVNDTHLWWSELGLEIAAIRRASLDGSGVETVITGYEEGPFPTAVAVDETHVYWTDGRGSIWRAKLDGRGLKEIITGVTNAGLAVDALPFTFGELKRNRNRGTATLTVNVPGPGELALAKTRKVKHAEKRAEAEGSVKLPVNSKGQAKKKLNRKGNAKVRAEVTFTPDGGTPNTESKRIELIKR